jgi:hypothetical protein
MKNIYRHCEPKVVVFGHGNLLAINIRLDSFFMGTINKGTVQSIRTAPIDK